MVVRSRTATKDEDEMGMGVGNVRPRDHDHAPPFVDLLPPATTAHHLPITTTTRWEPPRRGFQRVCPILGAQDPPRTRRTWPACHRPRWAPRAAPLRALGRLDEEKL